MATTAPPDARIVTLDIVRGVAVMGILAMNIVGFAMPDGAYMNPLAYGGHQGADLAAWAFNFVFVDGKMRGLFAFLFGASLLLVVERAEAAGRPGWPVHARRMVWLLLFGLVHLFLIWENDILHHYALIGLIAFAFRDKDARALVKWGIAALLLGFLILALIALAYLSMAAAAAAPDASAETLAGWADMQRGFAPLPAGELARELALYGGPYGPLVAERLSNWTLLFFMLFMVGPETLGYMLLGMAALKSGFLTGDWPPARYRAWVWRGLAIGVPVLAALAVLIVRSGFATETVVTYGMAAPALVRPFMVVAYAALIILLARRGGALVDRIAAAGRAAFSNYLGTSILMTTLFYGYGFGLFGDVGRAQLYLFVLFAWVLMLLWSKPWLERFRYGPLEWLWRSLAQGRVAPMGRKRVP